ncbi:MAG: ferrous iron transport protein A [Hyphomonadaceae bacterium]
MAALTLDQLIRGQRGRIVSIDGAAEDLAQKLRELGLCEGDEVELMARGPIDGQPIAVRLNRTLIALRRGEAQSIRIHLAP